MLLYYYFFQSFFDPFKTPEIVEAATAYKDMMSKQVRQYYIVLYVFMSNTHLSFDLLNKQRKLKGQSRMYIPEILTTLGTQDRTKTNKTQ